MATAKQIAPKVAPIILKALGLDPNALVGVRAEGTEVLPGIPVH